ncbi:MAG: CD225/dispanin family protein [Opitutaceae bacterium]|nr:CD225/dispanin family protein [Opitutaceae bacterium]
MTYHIARNNQQLGTFSKEDAAARYASGEILPSDLVWTEGMANWQPASQVFGAPAVPPPASPFVAPPPVPPVFPAGAAAPMTPAHDTTPRPVKPDNYLVWAILATVLCCLPLGIVSIIFAAQVDSKYMAGDFAGADAAAKKARLFAILSAGSALVIGVIYVIVMVAVGVAGAAGGSY